MGTKKQKQEELKCKFIVHSRSDPEVVTKILFGMSTEELVKDIWFNKDGKWDHLYQHENEAKS